MDNPDEKLAALIKVIGSSLAVAGERFRAMDTVTATGAAMADQIAACCSNHPDLPPIPEAADMAAAFHEYRDASQRLHTSIIRLIDRWETISEQILSGDQPPSE